MCTSRAGRPIPTTDGFTLLEVLVGLALSVFLVAAVAPLWISLGDAGVRSADRTIWVLQKRVAAARFERDMRLASAKGCPFASTGLLLEGSASQVVILTTASDGIRSIMVEWELVGGALMRRWGWTPPQRPAVQRHSLYVDHKTMLEGLAEGCLFSYTANGLGVEPPVAVADLASLDGVTLHLRPQEVGRYLGSSAPAPEFIVPAQVGR